MDDHQDGHDVVEADVYGEPKGHEAENPAGDKALPASPEFVVSWCQVKAKSFYFFKFCLVGSHTCFRLDNVCAVAQRQSLQFQTKIKTRLRSQRHKLRNKSEVLQFCIFLVGFEKTGE